MGKIKKAEAKAKKKIKEISNEVKKEVLFNVPNSLTLLRILLAFLFVYMLFSDYSKINLAIVFIAAAITDFLDGYLARKLKQTTTIGARLDQVIDRVFTVIIVLALIIYFIIEPVSIGNKGILYLFLITSREIIGLPGFSIRIIREKDAYKVRYIEKVTTFVQSVTIAAIILNVSFAVYFVMITFIIGLISGFDYLKDSLS